MPYIREDVKGVKGKTIIAKCPKCLELFNTYENWQGRGIMRKHCPPCKHLVDNMSGGLDEYASFSKYALINQVHTGRS